MADSRNHRVEPQELLGMTTSQFASHLSMRIIEWPEAEGIEHTDEMGRYIQEQTKQRGETLLHIFQCLQNDTERQVFLEMIYSSGYDAGADYVCEIEDQNDDSSIDESIRRALPGALVEACRSFLNRHAAEQAKQAMRRAAKPSPKQT